MRCLKLSFFYSISICYSLLIALVFFFFFFFFWLSISSSFFRKIGAEKGNRKALIFNFVLCVTNLKGMGKFDFSFYFNFFFFLFFLSPAF